MPHELTGSFKYAIGIVEFGPAEKAYIDVGCKRVRVAERSVANASGRMSVVEQFPNVTPQTECL